MNKVTLWLVAIFLVGAVAIAEAQQPTKVPRIGYLSAARSSYVTPPVSRHFGRVCASLAT